MLVNGIRCNECEKWVVKFLVLTIINVAFFNKVEIPNFEEIKQTFKINIKHNYLLIKLSATCQNVYV